MDKKIIGIGAMVMLVFAVFTVSLIDNNGNTLVGDSIKYGSDVCVYKNNELIGCQHNVVTTAGLNYVKNSLGEGGANEVSNIALGNTTAPAVGETALAGLYASCGLTQAAGTYNSNGDGNWSQAHTFTSTCDGIVVNTTALYKSGANMFAGTTFTATTLQTDDSLKINYTTWCS